jgi:hypothetical protein
MEAINMRVDEIAAAVKQAEALPVRSDNAIEILNKAQPKPKNSNKKKEEKPKFATRAEAAKDYRARVRKIQDEAKNLKKLSTPILSGMLVKALSALNKAEKKASFDSATDEHKLAGQVMQVLRSRYAIKFAQE